MADCTLSLQSIVAAGQVLTLDRIDHNTLTPLAFSRATCKSYALFLPAFTVVDFTVQVSPTPSDDFLFTIKFYRVTGNTMAEVATTSSADQTAVFSKEFTQGTYIVCFQTSSFTSFAGSVLAVFRGYQRYAVLDAPFSTGEAMFVEFDRSRPPKDCSAVLFFEIIEGTLPPGIRMTGLGQLLGTAPNLDCIADNALLPPSQNWSYLHNDGTFHPWGRQWRFKVKVSMEGLPDVNSEEWFCVKVHNNWSIDRDNFLAQAPYNIQLEDEIVTPFVMPVMRPVVIVEQTWQPAEIPVLCEGDTRTRFEVERIDTSICPDCNGKTEVVEAIPIPFGIPSMNPLYVKAWWEVVQSLAMSNFEFAEFVRRLQQSPIFAQYLQDRPVQVTEVSRQVILKTYSEDPNMLFWKWRREETIKLPWGLEVVAGEALTINMSDGKRT